MERMRKQRSESGNSPRATQGKFTAKSRANDYAGNVDNSPAMVAQRRKLQGLFGGSIQLQGAEGESVQGRFEAVQAKHEIGEEEFLPGRFGATQRVEEEEPLQGKFGAAHLQGMPAPQASSRTVAQLLTVNSTGSEASPVYDFTVDKSDLNKGTVTTKETREYVNSWQSVPGTVNYAYEIYDVSQSDQKVDQDTGTTPNPDPMKNGQNWDAGHSLGAQNGGWGHDTGWVFPQNPQFNRGNRYFGQKTYRDWRYCENVFHNSVYQYGKGRWKVWLS